LNFGIADQQYGSWRTEPAHSIFVIIGEAIPTAGPSIVLSFVLAGVTCVFSALAFAELSSGIPVSGSAHTYSYATLGELAARSTCPQRSS
jgi:amino acid transporter